MNIQVISKASEVRIDDNIEDIIVFFTNQQTKTLNSMPLKEFAKQLVIDGTVEFNSEEINQIYRNIMTEKEWNAWCDTYDAKEKEIPSDAQLSDISPQSPLDCSGVLKSEIDCDSPLHNDDNLDSYTIKLPDGTIFTGCNKINAPELISAIEYSQDGQNSKLVGVGFQPDSIEETQDSYDPNETKEEFLKRHEYDYDIDPSTGQRKGSE